MFCHTQPRIMQALASVLDIPRQRQDDGVASEQVLPFGVDQGCASTAGWAQVRARNTDHPPAPAPTGCPGRYDGGRQGG